MAMDSHGSRGRDHSHPTAARLLRPLAAVQLSMSAKSPGLWPCAPATLDRAQLASVGDRRPRRHGSSPTS